MSGKIIMNLAMSLDGYIADPNGGYDWIQGDGHKDLDTLAQMDFDHFLKGIDIIVMGRKAYEDTPMEPFKEKMIYVATSKEIPYTPNLKAIHENLVAEVVKQRDLYHKNIYLFGGGLSIDGFLKADQVDEIIIGIVPIILGKGRRLFLEDNPRFLLKLDKYSVTDGMMILHYVRRNRN